MSWLLDIYSIMNTDLCQRLILVLHGQSRLGSKYRKVCYWPSLLMSMLTCSRLIIFILFIIFKAVMVVRWFALLPHKQDDPRF